MKYIENDSYEDYKNNQIRTNKGKLKFVWITDREIDSIIEYVRDKKISISSGVCHGARNGYEVKKFRNGLKADIIGTDISETALDFDNMVQWDMHDRNELWIDKFDFVYSNSIDHSYDFNKCLDVWMESLTLNGICCIHWSTDIENPYNQTDCFGISKQELFDLLNTNYLVSDILEVNGKRPGTVVFIVKHKL